MEESELLVFIDWMKNKSLTRYTNIEILDYYRTARCRTFTLDYSNTSATKCKICGKEKFEHN